MSTVRPQAKIALCVLIGFALALLPEPEGLSPEGWRSFVLFAATILAVVLRPLPMGAVSLIGLTFAVSFGIVNLDDACSGFGNDVVWLVVFAFFISRGFINTGLGARLAYALMSKVGKSSLGLGYGLVATDLILAPCIPSVTARAGGIVYPILKSLAEAFKGPSHDPKVGAFLALTAYQGTAISSAMFLTAMAGNPMIAKLAGSYGASITWGSWAIAALVPGLLSMAIMPYLIYRLWPPSIRDTPHARDMAKERLRAMGPLSTGEKIVAATFALLLVLWIGGTAIGIKAAFAAMIGVSLFLFFGVLSWKDILEEHTAWDTLIWFATLVTLACQLNKTGFSSWFSQFVVNHMGEMPWTAAFFLLTLIYLYSHYLFASAVAHIGAMFAPFLIVAVGFGAPIELAALVLGFFSSLCTCLTHYGSGAAPILFGGGYASVGHWWKVGGICSLLYTAIWFLAGGVWWKWLGFW